MPSSDVRLNIRKNTFKKGSLAKQPWEGRSFDNPDDTRAYLLDRNFSGVWDVRPGDQVKARVVHETDKFVYVIPPDTNTPAPAKKETAPTPAPEPTPEPIDTGYGVYESPAIGEIDDNLEALEASIAELARANQIIDNTAKYFNTAVTSIALRHRIAKMELDKRIEKYKSNLKLAKSMGGSHVFERELNDLLAEAGRDKARLNDRMLGEIHRMAWGFIDKEQVRKDLELVYYAEQLFDTEEFSTRAATSYPFVLWMYSTGKYVGNTADNAWKFLTMFEEARINDALGQSHL